MNTTCIYILYNIRTYLWSHIIYKNINWVEQDFFPFKINYNVNTLYIYYHRMYYTLQSSWPNHNHILLSKNMFSPKQNDEGNSAEKEVFALHYFIELTWNCPSVINFILKNKKKKAHNQHFVFCLFEACKNIYPFILNIICINNWNDDA